RLARRERPLQVKDRPLRRPFAREEVKVIVGAEVAGDDLVLELRERVERPLVVGRVERELAAVAVRHDREDGLSVVARPELDLGDARKVLSEDVRVCRRAELVEEDLLEEIEILLRALALARVARVPEAGPVRVPRDAAAGGSAVDARDD